MSNQEGKSLQDHLRDLALDLSDTYSRVQATRKELSQGEAYLEIITQKYQTALAQLSVLDQFIKQQQSTPGVEPGVSAVIEEHKPFIPAYDYAQEEAEPTKKPSQKVNK